jgi:prepilin signal peptidase PulO-like enzyme (type II secretory pathway)
VASVATQYAALAGSPLALALGAAALGVCLVGPAVNHAILRWVGWRVVVPVLLGRVPERQELRRSPARCRDCGDPLGPAASAALPWAVSAGSCRGCGSRLPHWCGAVEAATGVSFGLAAGVAGWSASLVPVLPLFGGLVAMSAVDLWCMRIPTRFAHVTGVCVLAGLVVAAGLEGDAEPLFGAAVGCATFGGGLLTLYLVSPRMLGFGDVRLGAVAGLVIGWLTWTPEHPVADPIARVLGAALVAGLVGTVVGTVLLVIRRASEPFPFGPSLAVGTVVVVLTSL